MRRRYTIEIEEVMEKVLRVEERVKEEKEEGGRNEAASPDILGRWRHLELKEGGQRFARESSAIHCSLICF